MTRAAANAALPQLDCARLEAAGARPAAPGTQLGDVRTARAFAGGRDATRPHRPAPRSADVGSSGRSPSSASTRRTCRRNV
jgi:hypothetical protein